MTGGPSSTWPQAFTMKPIRRLAPQRDAESPIDTPQAISSGNVDAGGERTSAAAGQCVLSIVIRLLETHL